MRRVFGMLAILGSILLVSCQKEVDFANGSNNGNGGGNGGGNTNGDLLVKQYTVTPSTNDTATAILQWDASKRLMDYHQTGKLDGIDADIHYEFTRFSDGKLARAKETSALTLGLVDSVVHVPHYVTGTSKLTYDIVTQYTFIGDLSDSIAFTYNGAGYVSSAEDFSDVFGIITASSKQDYTYDANGNVTKIISYSANGTGGYDLVSTDTYTYGTHKTSFQLGDEAFIAIGATAFSKNDATGGHVAATNNPADTYDVTFSQQQYNSFDRPTYLFSHVAPQPPGYDLKLFLFYQ